MRERPIHNVTPNRSYEAETTSEQKSLEWPVKSIAKSYGMCRRLLDERNVREVPGKVVTASDECRGRHVPARDEDVAATRMSQWRDCRLTAERIPVTRRTYSGIVSGHAATIGPSSNVVRSISSRTADSGSTFPTAARRWAARLRERKIVPTSLFGRYGSSPEVEPRDDGA